MEQPAQQAQQQQPREITGLVLVSLVLLIGLGVTYTAGRRAEISANWAKYRSDPLLLFMAFMFKPDEDPRSRFQFAADNYSEVVKLYMDKVVAVALTPVYQIFGVLSGSIATTTEGLGGIKSLFGNLFKGFQSMVDIFMKRFGRVSHALKNTFRQLLQALQHVWSTAVASVYAGLSTIYTMQNTLRLMVNVVVTIMIILSVMMFFFFFALWPLLPVIILGGYMIGEMGPLIESATGGDGGAKDAASLAIGMCFAPCTRIVLHDGSDVAIQDIRLGDRLAAGSAKGSKGVVTGILRFEEPARLYSLHGVHVSGSHIVWEGDRPLFVKDHPDAKPSIRTNSVICLLTSHRRIPVLSDRGVLSFADWEELEDEDEDALQAWYERVDAVLNGNSARGKKTRRSDEEAGLSGAAPVSTPTGAKPLRDIKPGDLVLDASGGQTRVTGVVTLRGGPAAAHRLGSSHRFLTTGCWARLRKGGRWEQPLETTKHEEPVWHHLFTASGTFTLVGDVALRDFSDVGEELPTTYETTLKAMAGRRPGKTEAPRKPCCPRKPISPCVS